MELRGERESPPRALRVGADDDRRMRFLDRFWPGHHRLEVHEVAMILGLCPDHLYGLDTLARQLVAARESGAVVGHLVLVQPLPTPNRKQPPVGDYRKINPRIYKSITGH
jgi:hypothetical protein